MIKRYFYIPSIADIFFIVIFLYLSFSGGTRLLIDCDTGYHIRAGEFIIGSVSVPRYDIFSFISPPLPWIAHEWLSEVIMALVHRLLGLTGIVVLFAFVISLTASFFFQVIRSYKRDIILSALLVALVVGSTQLHWLARPHIFSLFFLVIWYYVLDLYQYGGKNYLYVLLIVLLFWVNMHGGFIVSFLLTGIYLFGNVVKTIMAGRKDKAKWLKNTKDLGFIMTLCFLISFINPYGYKILLFPFSLMSSTFIMNNIGEFLSPNFHRMMPFTYLLYLLITIFAVSKLRLNIIEALLIVMFTHMALYSVRFIPIFAIISAPIILKRADELIAKSEGNVWNFLKNRTNNITHVEAASRGHIWPIVTILLVVILSLNGKIAYSFDSAIKPADAAAFLNREKLTGNMFNEREFGDYIIYSLWPKYQVITDGRADVYGEEKMKEYFKVVRIEAGWNQVLSKYNINWIIHNTNSALSTFLLEREDWKIIYADKVASIFVRNTPENQYIINRYANVEKTVKNNIGTTE
jgi:hypothetical protein